MEIKNCFTGQMNVTEREKVTRVHVHEEPFASGDGTEETKAQPRQNPEDECYKRESEKV